MFISAEAIDRGWIVDLVNEFSAATRVAAGESCDPYQDILGRIDTPDLAAAIQDDDLADIADELFTVFNASPDPRSVAEQLDGMIQSGRPQLRVEGVEQVERVYLIDKSSSPLKVAAALSLLSFIEANGIERLGTCAAKNCIDVFIDRSQQRSRTYCSLTCQTRERVARHRQSKL